MSWLSRLRARVLAQVVRLGVGALRAQYETDVRRLAQTQRALARQGLSDEQVARRLHAMRRLIARRYKQMTPLPFRLWIYRRNIRRYGDRWGPSVEWLREGGRTWRQISESASRPGGHDVGL